ncbi:hypothetical protein BC670_0983 [Flavobacterium branchiophilum]|uniref:Uncharacterized protein n=3 Tax=Flavobacterium branchiophilum TaxID=55197 RepID=A0A543G1Z2_9FLAO|nr:hypothetical protein BC670_0983 [Flavobacterium branchiophilum]
MKTFLVVLIIVVLNNLSFGQQNRNVYTIGSTFSVSTGTNICYPATPVPIRSDPATNNTSATLSNTSNSHLYTTSPIGDLDVVIANAYARGFRKFYFQEGIYVISTPINLDGLHGITIEGSGARTVFKPSATTLEAIFKISNNYNSKIMNLNMDLKVTLDCANGYTATNDANTGIKIGTQVGRCLFEGLFFRSYIGNDNATMNSTSPILVTLTAGQESDWNTFNNIQFQRCTGGIVLDINQTGILPAQKGNFNSNKFSNIHFEHAKVAIEFKGNGGAIEGNLFTDIDLQGKKVAPDMTTDFVKNIRGDNNIFQNFQIADYTPGTGYVFSVASGATRTTIANCEVDGNFHSATQNSNEEKNGWYIDNGTGTQFLNNASSNRFSDFAFKNVNELVYEGQIIDNAVENNGVSEVNHPNHNNLFFRNFSRVRFNGKLDYFANTNSNVPPDFHVTDYKRIRLGTFNANRDMRTVSDNPGLLLNTANGNTGSLTEVLGHLQIQPFNAMALDAGTNNEASNIPRCELNTTTGQGQYMLTNATTTGVVQWTKISRVISGLAWDHIAIKNIKLDGFAITNNSNATPATNTDAGLRLDNAGNVRIGTAAPFTTNPAKLQVDGRTIIGTASQEMNDYDAAYKLIVNGKVRVRNEVYVKEAGLTWPDYVFANDYKLMPLQQVAQHIQEKGHLPNMPSATEVSK